MSGHGSPPKDAFFLSSSPPAAVLPIQSHPPHPSPPKSQPSRRLPPPCWSHEETVALIDGYRDMWYSLRRGNLKAHHWQEVADSVGARCPLAAPPKTPVQCRHKMEKLRKRYRTEIQRANSMPHSRFSSSWVHFKRMDSMEKGPSADPSPSDDDDEEDDDFETPGYGRRISNDVNGVRSSYSDVMNGGGGGSDRGSGFRIRIPNGVSVAKPGAVTGFRSQQHYASFDEATTTTGSDPSSGTLRDFSWARSGTLLGKRAAVNVAASASGDKRDGLGNALSEMVNAIKVLGDGFVKVEQMKMEMAREIEAMRMEMEMKRVEMVLESQERIVQAFAKAVSHSNTNNGKRMSSPE